MNEHFIESGVIGNSVKNNQPIHLLLRFSDSLLKDGDTIIEHNEVINREGAVWFGKLGSPVSLNHIDRLNDQVKAGVITYIYLVKGNRRKSIAYKAPLIFAIRDFPRNEQHLIPPYYTTLNILHYVRFWVKLGKITPITSGELNQMKVASSVLPISETLVKSSTGHFIIRESK
jgi:hypothetical protein